MLWERFAGVLGLDPARAEAPESRQNESLGLVEAELLRRFNARLGDRFPLRAPYINVVRDHLMRPALFGAPDAKRIGVPAEYADWVVQRSEQMVRDVRDLGDRIDVIGSADELAAAITLAEKAPSDLSDSELLEAALDAWVRQMENVEARREAARRQDPVGAGDAPGRSGRVDGRTDQEDAAPAWLRPSSSSSARIRHGLGARPDLGLP